MDDDFFERRERLIRGQYTNRWRDRALMTLALIVTSPLIFLLAPAFLPICGGYTLLEKDEELTVIKALKAAIYVIASLVVMITWITFVFYLYGQIWSFFFSDRG